MVTEREAATDDEPVDGPDDVSDDSSAEEPDDETKY